MIHEKLIASRKTNSLSQEEMAAQLGMEQTTYSRKERGISPISCEEWKRIAKVLNVSENDIKEEIIQGFKNENYIFNDQSEGLQYVYVHQDLLDTVLRYNKHLEKEIALLKKMEH